VFVQRQGDWLSAKVGDELVMMSATKGNYLGLSEVGARIWELIETRMPIDDICALLMTEFDVSPDVCRAEVETFLNELQTHGAVVLEAN
jgi:hypothetical protein